MVATTVKKQTNLINYGGIPSTVRALVLSQNFFSKAKPNPAMGYLR